MLPILTELYACASGGQALGYGITRARLLLERKECWRLRLSHRKESREAPQNTAELRGAGHWRVFYFSDPRPSSFVWVTSLLLAGRQGTFSEMP